MKKIYINTLLLMFFVLLISSNIIVHAQETDNTKFISRYETWSSDYREEELINYYLENNIAPTSAPDNTGNKLVYPDVANKLNERFPEYENWTVSNNKGYVSDVYGGNPLETSDSDLNDPDYNIHIAEAKRLAGITYDAIGCGPLKLLRSKK